MSQFAKKAVYGKSHSRQKELQNAIVSNLILRGNLPVNIVEQAWFKNFMQSSSAFIDLHSVSASGVTMDTTAHQTAPPISKRAKLFSFMSSQTRLPTLPSTRGTKNLTLKDISQQLTLFTSDNGIAGGGLQIFNDMRFSGLRPLARKLFTAPASSAASERVFSRAGLVMRPTRSRLSEANLSKLVFLGCNSGKF
jgi:hypothetical protein